MEPLSMPFRRPQRTLVSGVGVAGAVLAAVIVTFTLVSGIVAYNLTSVDSLPRTSDTLVLESLRTDAAAAEPLVLRRARVPAAQRRSAPAAAAPAPARTSTRRPAVAVVAPQVGGGSAATTQPPQHPAEGAAVPPARPAPDRVLEPVGHALGATGQAVGATTQSLARRIDAVTATAGAAVAATRDVLSTTADRSGRLVGRLLDGPPAR
jgi:hypothetical protein